MQWESVIGLEVHAQLKTESKLFSGASTAFGAPPNTQASFIDVGLPGVLPVLNQKAVHMAVRFGLAIDAQINDLSFFERKNYFYPDLPKGYQISQLQKPIVSNGRLTIPLSDKRFKDITIVRAHLEEDAGKSLHEQFANYTGVDLNRAGNPLLEIVTAPCLYSVEEVISYLKTLHQLVCFIDICDGNMQEGSFRCDVNFSLRPRGETALGVRTELKNLNSFRFIEKALAYEYARHQDLLESGQRVIQETRLYNPDTNTTHPLRQKESENDYRYFPDPDLLPIVISTDDLIKIKEDLPERPSVIRDRLQCTPDLKEEDIHFLLSSYAIWQFYEKVKKHTKASEKSVVNWLKGPYLTKLNEQQLTFSAAPIAPQILAQLLDKMEAGLLSFNNAKMVFSLLWNDKEEDIDHIIEREELATKDASPALALLIHAVLNEYPDQVAQYKGGKEKLLAFFVGQVMKKAKGQAEPEQVSQLLREHLS